MQAQRHQHGVGFDEIATGRAHFGHRAGARRLQAQLHLHRFDHHQLLSGLDRVPAAARTTTTRPGIGAITWLPAPAPVALFVTIHRHRLQAQPTLAVMDHEFALIPQQRKTQ